MTYDRSQTILSRPLPPKTRWPKTNTKTATEPDIEEPKPTIPQQIPLASNQPWWNKWRYWQWLQLPWFDKADPQDYDKWICAGEAVKAKNNLHHPHKSNDNDENGLDVSPCSRKCSTICVWKMSASIDESTTMKCNCRYESQQQYQ